MFADELRSRVQKSGQAPGTAMYTGDEEDGHPLITVVNYHDGDVQKKIGHNLQECLFPEETKGITWVNIEGLKDTDLINEVAKRYSLHPLTVEDILNVEQRPKVEEFDEYYFVVLRMLVSPHEEDDFSIEQISVVFGKNFVLSFQEKGFHLFDAIRDRIAMSSGLAYVMEKFHGYRLPVNMQKEFSLLVKKQAIQKNREITADDAWDIFMQEYLKAKKPFELKSIYFEKDKDNSTLLNCNGELLFHDKKYELSSSGNGVIDTVINYLNKTFHLNLIVDDYYQHALSHGSDSIAASYIRQQT